MEKMTSEQRCRRWDTFKMDMIDTACEGVDWIYLAHCGAHWRSVSNIVMHIRGISWPAERLSVS